MNKNGSGKALIELPSEHILSVLANVSGLIFYKNEKGHYVWCNNYYATFVGYSSPAEIINKTDFDLNWSNEFLNELVSDDKSVLLSGIETSKEYEVKYKDKIQPYQWIQLDRKPIHNKQNQIIGFIATGSDITSQKLQKAEMMQEYRFLQNIFYHLPGLIYWKNKYSRYMGFNQNVVKLSGLSKEDLVGKSDLELNWGEREAESFIRDDQEIMSTGMPHVSEYEVPIKRDDGKDMMLRTVKSPLYNEEGQIMGILAVAVDITELKNTQRELQVAKEKAEAANYIMTEFIANMGHDLATPISDVGSVAEMLSFYVEDYPEFKELFETLVERCAACEEVRGHIINATSISNLEIQPEPFSILQELLVLGKEFRPAIMSKNLKLIIQPIKPKKEDVIETDRVKLYAILVDLLSNAINFTNEGSITISTVKQDGWFIIKVTDTGIGIPSDKYDYIFEQYTKLSRSNKHGATFKGVGAGLYLAKIRANILGGTIHVESELGKGSTFTLSVPARTIKN